MISKFDSNSSKAIQGFSFEDAITKDLNEGFQKLGSKLRAYTLRALHEMHPTLAFVRAKRNTTYFSSIDTFQGDIIVFDESDGKFGRVVAGLGCKSVNGDAPDREATEFLEGAGHYSVVGLALYDVDRLTGFDLCCALPGSSALDAYRMTDATLGKGNALPYVPIQNLVMVPGAMTMPAFIRHLASQSDACAG